MVTAVVLDAGALIALDRGNREAWADLAAGVRAGSALVVPAGVVAQVWRDGSRQARLAQALKRLDDVPLDGMLARLAGSLCGRAGTTDVIDATVALLAASYGKDVQVTVVTSDGADIEQLLAQLPVDNITIATV